MNRQTDCRTALVRPMCSIQSPIPMKATTKTEQTSAIQLIRAQSQSHKDKVNKYDPIETFNLIRLPLAACVECMVFYILPQCRRMLYQANGVWNCARNLDCVTGDQMSRMPISGNRFNNTIMSIYGLRFTLESVALTGERIKLTFISSIVGFRNRLYGHFSPGTDNSK